MKNNVNLIGNLGNNPEISYTPQGMAVVKFSLATWYFTRNKKKVTTWHNIVAFKETAENIARYLKKGSKVDIEGMIRNGSFEGNDGSKKYFSEVVVRTILYLNTPPQNQNAVPQTPSDSPQNDNNQEENEHMGFGDTPPDDDIHF